MQSKVMHLNGDRFEVQGKPAKAREQIMKIGYWLNDRAITVRFPAGTEVSLFTTASRLIQLIEFNS